MKDTDSLEITKIIPWPGNGPRGNRLNIDRLVTYRNMIDQVLDEIGRLLQELPTRYSDVRTIVTLPTWETPRFRVVITAAARRGRERPEKDSMNQVRPPDTFMLNREEVEAIKPYLPPQGPTLTIIEDMNNWLAGFPERELLA